VEGRILKKGQGKGYIYEEADWQEKALVKNHVRVKFCDLTIVTDDIRTEAGPLLLYACS
jgi:hypothetical protein